MAIAFVVAIAGPIFFTRFGGGVACLWLATAVLAPYLAKLPLRRWPVVLAVAATSGGVVTATIGLGPLAAVPMTMVCTLESVLIGLCLRIRNRDDEGTLASNGQVAVLLVAAACVSALTGFLGAGLAAWVTATPYWHNWFNWTAGHALGTITFAPIMLLLLRGDAATWLREASRAERIEAAFIGAVVGITAMACFSQHAMPLLFLPILPVMMATFRVGRIGAAASIVVVALIATAMTLRGEGPIALIDASPAFRIQFMQFYLAAVVLTVLPAAADLRRRKEILGRLAVSEGRYRLVSENATDVVLNVDVAGVIGYISPSVAAFGGGYAADALTGTNSIDLVLPEDQAAVRKAYQIGIREMGVTQMIEYRGLPAADPRGVWLEARFRSIETPQGIETVCAIRDISRRKAVETELMLAASTDPLTGLNNRRVFNDAVDASIAGVTRNPAEGACVAIFDIDHFKAINDTHGHDAGDRVLQRFAEVAAGVTRAQDLVARLGGEEFGVLLPGASHAQAEIVCDRLRAEFARSAVESDAGIAIRATVSAGIAWIGADDHREAILRAADGALYAAKRGGRNRLVMAA